LPVINPFNTAQAVISLGPGALPPAIAAAAQGFATHFFIHALLVAAGIVAAVTLAAVIAGTVGSSDAPTTSNAATVQGLLSQIPAWYKTLPPTGIALLTAGLVVSGTSITLTPGSLFRHFSVPTVDLKKGLPSTNGDDGTAALGKVLVTPGAGPGGSDMVTLLYPNANTGKTDGIMFYLDSNGFLINNKNGTPANTYLPFFQPIVDGNGKVTGIKRNPGALNALMQMPGCMAVANNTSMPAKDREAALETCMRNSHDVAYVAGL
jgi:hypothetical protein